MALSDGDNNFKQAMALFQAGRLNDAERYFKKVLRHLPKHVAALNLLGVLLTQLKRYTEAELYIKAALKLNSNSDVTFYNYGLILKALQRPNEALERFSQALSINATVAETWNNRGTVFNDLKHYDDAIADFNKAIALQPNYSDAFCNKGKSLAELRRFNEAFAAYDRALALKPDLAEAWLGRGNVFTELKRYDEAFAAYDRALAFKPDLAEAWLGRGSIFTELKRYDEAFAAYDKALALKPDLDNAEGLCLYAKMHLCNWSNFAGACTHLISSVKSGIENPPFALLAVSPSPEVQLQCAKCIIKNRYPPFDKPISQIHRYNHDRIRIAYISADFREHAVSYLIAGLIENHSKEYFDVTGISLKCEDPTETGQRMKRAFGKFIDVSRMTDEEIAHLIREFEVDIAIDLMGFTQAARTGIFAQRPAPIQVNYLGFPGTMGATYIDYIIADQIVIPNHQQEFYSEKIVYMPHSFQANDRGRSISEKIFTRAEHGLPQDGFVFCCFNSSNKIIPPLFDIWMRILNRIDNSVLWLVANDKTVEQNLRNEAAARSINPARLVLAPRIPYPEHLARLSLANLFLDTEPFNAGTSASDALWAGLPVLTRVGGGFAGRMATSLLNAIGLHELITSTPQAYEDLAIELATNPEKLAAIKQKLSQNRLTKPLFNTQLFTRHIEAAYKAMYERYQAGLPPDNIHVPPVSKQNSNELIRAH
jgi:protein O-GlcNAc transferase